MGPQSGNFFLDRASIASQVIEIESDICILCWASVKSNPFIFSRNRASEVSQVIENKLDIRRGFGSPVFELSLS